MSLRIEIHLADDGDVSRAALARHMDTLGFTEPYRMPKTPGFPDRSIPGDVQVDGSQIVDNGQKPTEPAKRTTRKKDAAPAISTNPEDRKPPEDDAETQAQDEADEAAEVEAARAPEKPLTVDDIRGAMKGYVDKFDMAAAQQDGVAIFEDALGKPPAGEGAWKVSLLAELSQDRIKAAFDAWTAASAGTARYKKRG